MIIQFNLKQFADANGLLLATEDQIKTATELYLKHCERCN